MKLVLYSGGQQRSNHQLHQAVVGLARQARHESGKRTQGLKLTYFPFCSESSNLFYHRAVRRFRANGVEHFACLRTDAKPTPSEITEAFKTDIIYLAGGNTFYFLKHLQEAGVMDRLKTFAKKGGVIAGLSAGGLIMSPTIRMAGVKDLDPDENEVRLKNLKGLGLFQFEFSPHYEPRRKRLVDAHVKYSKKSKYPIFALEDGSGIVINGNELTVHGNGCIFDHGRRIIL